MISEHNDEETGCSICRSVISWSRSKGIIQNMVIAFNIM